MTITYFAKKNEGWWTVPKGELLNGELPLVAAIREFEEETGVKLKEPFMLLEPIVQKAGKKVYCWANHGDIDAQNIVSNMFEMEWPPKSGIRKEFPEIDKAGWFLYDEAKVLINERQVAFLDELLTKLKK